MTHFDIPINISVYATNEQKAEQQVLDFMVKAIKEYGVEHCVADFEYFEFVAEESSNSGRRDNNISEGQRSCEKKQACHCPKQSCC